jgi:hypothetical protein
MIKFANSGVIHCDTSWTEILIGHGDLCGFFPHVVIKNIHVLFRSPKKLTYNTGGWNNFSYYAPKYCDWKVYLFNLVKSFWNKNGEYLYTKSIKSTRNPTRYNKIPNVGCNVILLFKIIFTSAGFSQNPFLHIFPFLPRLTDFVGGRWMFTSYESSRGAEKAKERLHVPHSWRTAHGKTKDSELHGNKHSPNSVCS